MTVTQKPRSVVITGLLALIVFGWSHLYIGRLSRLMLVLVAIIATTIALGLSGVLSSFPGVMAFMAMWAGLYLFMVVDPIWLAYKSTSFTPRWYNRWYVYVLWLIVIFLLPTGLKAVRGPVLGLDLFRMRSSAMSPLIEQGDFVAVDTKAFVKVPPSVGDLVVVKDSSTGKSLLGQVMSVSVSSVVVGTLGGEGSAIDASQLKGRLICIFFSHDRSRLGALPRAVVQQSVPGDAPASRVRP